MKRFLKTFALLVVSLFLVVTGVDAALDHLSRTPTQNSLTVYNEKGNVVLAFNGDLNCCKAMAKPVPANVPTFRFLHRT